MQIEKEGWQIDIFLGAGIFWDGTLLFCYCKIPCGLWNTCPSHPFFQTATNSAGGREEKVIFPNRGLDFCVPHHRRYSSSSASLSSVTWAGDAVFQEEQHQGACEPCYQQDCPSSTVEKSKRTERSCSWCKVWSGHLSPLEPAGAGAGRVSPILFGLCLLCVVTWTCSSVFMEVFSENLFQGLPGGHSDPRGTWCGSALLHPSESPFGYVHSLLRLRRNGVLHIWVQTCVLCSVTGGKENIIVLS